MKLSEKGIKRFNHLYWEEDEQLHEIEFEPSDFKGMVCLPIDEAKTIANKLNDNSEFYFLQTGNFDFYTIELMDYLDDLIEQAEKSK